MNKSKTSNKGRLFILSAPAGTGKTTLVHLLRLKYPRKIKQVITCTTRAPRELEKDGRDYHFLSVEEFQKKIKNQEFLEWAQVFSHYYGTRKEEVFDLLNQGFHVILVIDTQGAKQLRETKVEATFIFLTPPSIEVLKKRLSERNSESEKSLEERLSWAQKEIEAAKSYDFTVVNDRLEVALKELEQIILFNEAK